MRVGWCATLNQPPWASRYAWRIPDKGCRSPGWRPRHARPALRGMQFLEVVFVHRHPGQVIEHEHEPNGTFSASFDAK